MIKMGKKIFLLLTSIVLTSGSQKSDVRPFQRNIGDFKGVNISSVVDHFKTAGINRIKRQITTYCVPNTNNCLELDRSNKKLFYVENRNLYAEKFGVIIILLENNLNQIIKEIIIGNKDTYLTIANRYGLLEGMPYKDNYKVRVYMTSARNNHVNLSDFFEIKNDALIKYVYPLKQTIKVTNLGNIKNKTDEIILNELNYLNPNLNVLQVEITEKDNQSATIEAKIDSEEYTGSIKIYYTLGNTKNKVVDLSTLIKKALFFENKRFMTSYTVKRVNKIFTDNLIYSDVAVRKSVEPIINNATKNICSGKTILENNLSVEQIIKTSACRYTIELTDKSQITKGLSRTFGQEITAEVGSSSSNTNSRTNSSENTAHTSQTSSNTIGGGVSASVEFFGFFSIGGSGNIENQVSTSKETSHTDFMSSTSEYMTEMTENLSKTATLSNNFDLSNSKEVQQTKTYELELSGQEINVKNGQLLEVHHFLDEVTVQVTLNLKQNIYGQIKYETIDVGNKVDTNEISIKEVMSILDKYGLLPEEIVINKDNSVTFNGKASISKQVSTFGQIKLTEIPKNGNKSSSNIDSIILCTFILFLYVLK